ncbi:OsmC family protein [Ramlibacter tataouinensis]|uniref:OsmC family protein n=1 Tax=Ramlibacter tataouinensis TaxID=94132 RepID=UPI0022F3C07B|nr:OsmC family protein [Ramlibacter tataouinensis]WBY02844.1 OsmC family protein [Ramlibacter tataouinensis]
MSMDRIKQSIGKLSAYLGEHPQKAVSQDPPAVAVLESGLRCRAQGPRGASLATDMPTAVGGESSAPTPGWLLRAALASCDATVIAMRAAQLGIVLDKLEVTVDSESDNRGLLGLAESAPAGPLGVRVTVRLSAPGTPEEAVRALVDWAEKHSPVSDAMRRALPVATQLIVE